MDKQKNVQKDKREHVLISHWRVIALYLVIYDAIAINFSFFFALLLRFEFSYRSIPEAYLGAFIKFAPIYTLFTIVRLIQRTQ